MNQAINVEGICKLSPTFRGLLASDPIRREYHYLFHQYGAGAAFRYLRVMATPPPQKVGVYERLSPQAAHERNKEAKKRWYDANKKLKRGEG